MTLRKVTKEESEYLYNEYGHGMDVVEDFVLVVALISILAALVITDDDTAQLSPASWILVIIGLFLILHVAVTCKMKRSPLYYTRFYCCVFNIKDTGNRVLSYIGHDMLTLDFRAGTKNRWAVIMINDTKYTGDIIILSKKMNMKSLLFAYPFCFRP